MADESRDPFALWRKMIGEMEKGFNAFANQAMSSPQFSKTMNQAGSPVAAAISSNGIESFATPPNTNSAESSP